MITRQHVAITLMSHGNKGTLQTFKREVPWVLLPDAIRAYAGPRQMSHFEQLPDGTDTAWMKFPSETVLKGLSKENFAEKVAMYLPKDYPKCVIGETTNLDVFDVKCYSHPHYHSIRMHMVQDVILDNVLRDDLVDVTGRFSDYFKVRWNHRVIDGATLRKQVALFEELGFIYLAGRVYESTGKLMNQKWFEEFVLEPLKAVYPADLAENTFKYMSLSEGLDKRISEKNFELSDADKEGFFLCDNLEEVLDGMYAMAYYHSAREL